MRAERKIDAIRFSADWTIQEAAPTTIWFEVEAEGEILDQISLHSEPFLVALVVPSMERGVNLHIDWPVSDEQVYKTNEFLVPLLKSMFPQLEPIKVTASASEKVESKQRHGGAITGMSCGLDSFATLRANSQQGVPESMKIRAFLFHDVGASGTEGRDGRLFQARFQRAKAVATSLQIPLIKIRSNIAEIFKTSFVQTHTIRNAAAASVMRDIAGSYLYSSTFAYSGIHGGRTWDCATADPILLPLLSTADFEHVSAGAGLSRLDKTLAYMDAPLCLDQLDICTSPKAGIEKNCGKCGKCGRFLMVGEARGELDRYSEVFDLNRYKSRRWHIARRMTRWSHQRNLNPNDRDHLMFIAQAGLKLPWSARAAGRIAAAMTHLFAR